MSTAIENHCFIVQKRTTSHAYMYEKGHYLQPLHFSSSVGKQVISVIRDAAHKKHNYEQSGIQSRQ